MGKASRVVVLCTFKNVQRRWTRQEENKRLQTEHMAAIGTKIRANTISFFSIYNGRSKDTKNSFYKWSGATIKRRCQCTKEKRKQERHSRRRATACIKIEKRK